MPPIQTQAQRRRPAAPSASATQTITNTSSTSGSTHARPTLRLRAEDVPGSADSSLSSQPPRRRVQWAANVINNEGLGRKSSKVCCIYHPPRAAGEESSEEERSSSSSSGEDSDSDVSDMGPRRSRQQAEKHGHECNGHGKHKHGTKKKRRQPSPNAYEKQPTINVQKNGADAGAVTNTGC